jgi:D-serine deaminase-like pyridoxal phosphate-dependent protein
MLDEDKCRANIRRMAEKSERSNARFRPHFKTHQSLAIGEWFRDAGVTAITVSSVKMADYFSKAWRDITVAVPFNLLETDRINRIDQDCMLNLCVMHVNTVKHLASHLERDVGVYIKVDVGYHRTGLVSDDPRIQSILDYLEKSARMTFKGFLGHAGHSYYANSRAEVDAVARQSREIMFKLRERHSAQFPALELSLGDTPSCSVIEDFTGVDELRPGNLVFYDLTQYTIGSCSLGDIAVAMACPIIASQEGKLIIHGGSVHFSKDCLKDKAADGRSQACYGWVVEASGTNWSGAWRPECLGLKLTALSQELGAITGPEKLLAQHTVGDILLVYPVHSCLTASEMKAYTTLKGERLLHLEAEYPLISSPFER